MGGCCSNGVCCAPNGSPKPEEAGEFRSKNRPWRHNGYGSLHRHRGGLSSNETFSTSRSDGLLFKNHHLGCTSSSDGIARSSSIFVDTEEDGYEYTAMSQLLVQVTDLLVSTSGDDKAVELRFSPSTHQNLEKELLKVTQREEIQQFPILGEILRVSSPQHPMTLNNHELNQLESELFNFLTRSEKEHDLDPFVTLHRCLASSRVLPPYNRFLQLHLRSLLQHQAVQESEEIKEELMSLLSRLESSPGGMNITWDDGNFLLELITLTNAPIFSSVSTPPVVFNHRASPLIIAAMRIASLSLELRRLAETGEIVSEPQKALLEATLSLATAKENRSCPSIRFYSKIISHRDRSRLSELVTEILNESKSVTSYKISREKANDLSELSVRLGEVALTCAKFKVAKANHIVKNRFRISSDSFQRICIIEGRAHELMNDALILLNSAGLATSPEVESFLNAFDGKQDVVLSKEEAAYLEHLFTNGMDFRSPGLSCWKSFGETTNSISVIDDKEERIDAKDSKDGRNPLVPSKTPEQTDTVIDNFFGRNDSFTYENVSLNKPVVTSFNHKSSSYQDDFSSSKSDLASMMKTLPRNDSFFYFKLLTETLLLRKAIVGIQRSTSQFFAAKLAPFQIIQLCDCVRKLSSVEPRSEDSKLIKKLSIEANRHVKFKLKVKNIIRLKAFYQRIQAPVFQGSSVRLNQILQLIRKVSCTANVNISAEDSFNLAEIASAVLFNEMNSLSLIFLESIKQRCMNSASNAVTLSKGEFEKLSSLANETRVRLDSILIQPLAPDKENENVSLLLCLYKFRALINAKTDSIATGMSRRMLWNHALTHFFNYYPSKALRYPFCDVAFKIFIEESDHLSGDLKQCALLEIQTLIDSFEKSLTSSPEAVKCLLVPKTKRVKVLTALKLKFVVSSVNNRQLNCDPAIVGKWISALASNPEDSLATFLDKVEVEELRQFLLTQPETQELNEVTLTESLSVFGTDEHLASFDPPELTRIISLVAGIGQSSARSNLLYILLLEALMNHCDKPKILVERFVFAELQRLASKNEADDSSIETFDKLAIERNNTDESSFQESVQHFVTELLSDQSKLASPEQYDQALKTPQDIRTSIAQNTSEFETLKYGVNEFEKRLDWFLISGNSLLYAITSLRGIIVKLKNQNSKSTGHTALMFVLNICLRYIPTDTTLHESVSAQLERLREGLVQEASVEINLGVIGQLLVSLERKLTTNVLSSISGCLLQISSKEQSENLDCVNILQFICTAVPLLPVDVETKLLAVLLCNFMHSLRPENRSTVQAIISAISRNLLSKRQVVSSRRFHLLTALLPQALNSSSKKPSIEFETLIATLCLADGLAHEIDPMKGAQLYHQLAGVFWSVFFNHDHLTLSGDLGDLYILASRFTSEWLSANSLSPIFLRRLFVCGSRLPIDETQQGNLPSEVKDDVFPVNSYFNLLQWLFVIESLMSHTDEITMLAKNHLITLYHAVVNCLHSNHFRNRLETKTSLLLLLNQIETHFPRENYEQVPVKSLHLDFPIIHQLVKSNVLASERSLVDNLRSHLTPLIRSLGCDTEGPFKSINPNLLREGLEISLCGYFDLSPQDALSAVRILSQVRENRLSEFDLSIICQIISHIFENNGRFRSVNISNNCCVFDFPEGVVRSVAIEAAFTNLSALSAMGGLHSTQDVEIFLKSVFALSSFVRLTYTTDSLVSETVVTSPSGTFSSFSVKHESVSLESSPILLNVSQVPSPEVDLILASPIRTDVKLLFKKIDIGFNDVRLPILLEIYHHSRLMLQSPEFNRAFIKAITIHMPELNKVFMTGDQALSDLQIKTLEETSQECEHRIHRRFNELLMNQNDSLSVRLLYGYFSMGLPTSNTLPTTANKLMSLRIAEIEGDVAQSELWSFVNDNLKAKRKLPTLKTTALAIQGAQKALEGFTLNTVEQICLLHSLENKDIRFADLGAAINRMKIWPILLSQSQRQVLKERIAKWMQSMANQLKVLRLASVKPSDTYDIALINEIVGSPKAEVVKIIDQAGDSSDLAELRETIEPSNIDIDTSIEVLSYYLSLNMLDEFVVLKVSQVISILRCLRQISENSDWFHSIKKIISLTRQRLYLSIACCKAIDNGSNQIDLPRKYLRLQEIASILRLHMSEQRKVSSSLSLERIGSPVRTTLSVEPRKCGIQSMELISGRKQSNKPKSCYKHLLNDEFDSSDQLLTFKRSSLSRLQELIEIRRAVVAGSKSELNRMNYGLPVDEYNFHPPKSRLPDKLDLSMLRRRCQAHTNQLIQRANYEQEQAELFCKVVTHNARLAS